MTELGREPYDSEVQEATERELAILGEKSSARKGKVQVKGACSATCEQEMVKIQRRLQAYEEFVKLWEPKLKKWDAYFDDNEETKSVSDFEGNREEAPGEPIDSECRNSKGDKHKSGDEDSEQSSSHSGSGDSNIKSGSESKDEEEDGTVKETLASADVDRPGSSDAAEKKDDAVEKTAGLTTMDVSGKAKETGEQVKSAEAMSKSGVKNGSNSTVKDQTVSKTAKSSDKVPVKEVHMCTAYFLNCVL